MGAKPSDSLACPRKRSETPTRCSDPQRHCWGEVKGGGKAAFFKSKFHKVLSTKDWHRERKILTGWSASRSDPYISTRFAHLSKSEIFFGNQGTFSMSRERMESTKLLITASVLREEMLLSSMAMVVTSKIYKLKGSWIGQESPLPIWHQPTAHTSSSVTATLPTEHSRLQIFQGRK